MNTWREWFLPPDEEIPVYTQEADIRDVAGSGHRDADDNVNPYIQTKTPQPRCTVCKKFVGYSTGMHLMVTAEHRIHVSCFAEVLERHYEDGEVIDLETGAILQIDDDS